MKKMKLSVESLQPAIFLSLLMDCLGICVLVNWSRFKSMCLMMAIA
jgi:hypothetical protein